jgi:FSR family fosmidomycin resistance protein-like MFS transporter
MQPSSRVEPELPPPLSSPSIIIPILTGISVVHFLNDIMQAVVPATFPILQRTLRLSYTELGAIAFANSMTASVAQPLIGWYTDRKPQPYLLLAGMSCTLVGMALLATAETLGAIIIAVMLVGLGSAVFHPEASRIVLLASGARQGFGQSLFQVGGNMGTSLAPLMTILIFAPFGQFGVMWFVGVAAIALMGLYWIALWYKTHIPTLRRRAYSARVRRTAEQIRIIRFAVALVFFLAFVRAWFVAGIGNFYSLFQMQHFGAPLSTAQTHTFVFLFAGAVGTLFGGVFADRFGKKNALLFSTLGCAPFAVFLPFTSAVGAPWLSYTLVAGSGFAILTGFTVALIYMFDLLPGRTGMVSGLMFGLAFGLAAIGSIALGSIADAFGIDAMMTLCSALPILGLATFLLPNDKTIQDWRAQSAERT